MDDYKCDGHSKYSLSVHLIFVTKYRKILFKDTKMKDDIKQYLFDASNKYRYMILEMETDKKHVHILLSYRPDVKVSTIVKELKQYSTYQMWLHRSDILQTVYWKKKALWSDGYFACSIGQVSQDIIEKYIQNQG